MTPEEKKKLIEDLKVDLQAETEKRDNLVKQIEGIESRATHDTTMLKWDLSAQKKKISHIQALIEKL